MDGLPEDEQDHAWVLDGALSNLSSLVKDFRSALCLYEYCLIEMRVNNSIRYEVSGDFIGWATIAARDGAMTIYHFRETMDGIRQYGVKSCPTLSPFIDTECLRRADRRFQKLFPKFAKIRHSVAHSANRYRNLNYYEKNSFSGTSHSLGNFGITEAQSVVITNCLMDRTFATTWEGQILSYDITEQTLSNLTAIKSEFYKAFHKAIAESVILSGGAHRVSTTK